MISLQQQHQAPINAVQGPPIVIEDDDDGVVNTLAAASISTAHEPEILIRVETESIHTGKLLFD